MALGEPDVVTVERERVDYALLRGLADHCAVHPNADAVEACGDRFREKQLLDSAQLPSAPYVLAETAQQVREAAEKLGLPVVVKSPTEGYDGKQQWHLLSSEQLNAFCAENPPGAWLVESRIAFEREVSMLAARSANGDVALYPPTENRHRDGILLTSIAPAADMGALQEDAFRYISSLLEAMNYVGVLAMESFVTPDGLLINELAPRVHNSGHWTLHGEVTNQFENHLRAILGMSLGVTEPGRCHGMINVLGAYDHRKTLLGLSPHARLTDYRKSHRPLRKLAHITVCCQRRDEVERELSTLHHQLYGDPRQNSG
jgi:5-(carboxyamino)imidazole ribonucleotide synthase